MEPIHSEDNINSFFVDQVKDYAIFTTDPNGIINSWNKGAERLKGYTEAEIIGQHKNEELERINLDLDNFIYTARMTCGHLSSILRRSWMS
ncbi:PAS domain S-box protein [Rufibacter radiotolerans]|uniref:PAS domain S-box protein n=1 Tax=Rufibacter radiotolerans TaxID=1379910 RepID=UPI0009E28773|nr:PAS domain S-box protein [Rufibacter radiotolerans]